MGASTALTNFLKTKYDKGAIPREVVQEFPFLDAVPKFTDGGGDYFVTGVVIGNPEGLGATLAIAQANAAMAGTLSDFKGKKWIVPYGDDSGVVYINDKDIKRARHNEDAFFNWFDEEINGIWRSFLTRHSTLMFSETGLYIASATNSTGVLTLTNPADVVNFAIGMTLQASSDPGDGSGGNTLLGSGSIGYVFAVNANTGTVTVATSANNAVAGTAGTPGSWGSSLIYLFRQGDYQGGATPNVIYKGLGGWIPPTDPTTGDSWYNVDRSVAPAKLAGFRLTAADVAGMSLRKRIKRACAILNNRGTTPGATHVVINGEKWQDLADELESQGIRILDGQKQYGFGASSIALSAGGKVVEVIGDRFCRSNVGFALTMPKDGSNIVMKSLRAFPHVIGQGTDGLDMLRKTDSNDFEHRGVAYPAFCVAAPGWCGRADV
jgi:hypothetical protein